MPQRQSVHKIPSETVQGADSFVCVRRMTVAEFETHDRRLRAVRKAQAEGDQAECDRLEAETRDFYASVLIDWNWVDDAGEDLPKPSKNVDVIKTLTMDEIEFLTGVIMMGGGEKKVLMPSTKQP